MSHPKLRRNTSGRIIPAKEPYNPEEFPPRFSFRFLVEDADFGFESLDSNSKVALMNTLYKLSRLTWAQIRLAHKYGSGHEKIEPSALNFKWPQGIPTDRPIPPKTTSLQTIPQYIVYNAQE